MKVAVIGSGLAGLCAATELARHGSEVEVLERRAHHGGRAGVVGGAEHCSRIMMDDYSRLRELLERVPSATPGRSIWATLVPVRRMVHLERRGWVPLSRIYALRAPELSFRDRCELAAARRRRPLLAEQARTSRLSMLRMAAQLSPAGWARVAAATWRVDGARAFAGATDSHLIDPWVDHLRRSGVELRTATTVERLRRCAGGAELHHSGAWHRYGAVVVTAFVPDARRLLEASGTPFRLRVSDLGLHSCASATFLLDEREPLVGRHADRVEEAYLYSGGGLYALYQPRLQRVVAVSTRPGPDGTALLDAARKLLQLRHEVDLVGVRDNSEPSARLFGATPPDPRRVLGGGAVHFAGGYLSRSYPLDSGEAAARSALAATRAILSGAPR